MAGAAANAAIIIKKVKKGGHGGHHGGAWKVAYADFVTAMMAFFLLLWLLNATTAEQKQGIADYFTPASVSKSFSGSGGVMGGQTMTQDGALQSDRTSVGMTIALPAEEESLENQSELARNAAEPIDAGTELARSPEAPNEAALESRPDEGTSQAPISEQELQDRLAEMQAQQEQEQFEAVEQALQEAIQGVPELKDLANHLMIDQTPEGLRIQIVDQNERAMFPIGSATMHQHTKKLIQLVVGAIKDLPQKIAIKGHTDATPYRSDNGYSNWELSTDRANASRRALLESGLVIERVESVAGRAAQEPLLPDDPTNARNRRISIILLREAKPTAQGAPKSEPEPFVQPSIIWNDGSG